jgi:hypothetical protein
MKLVSQQPIEPKRKLSSSAWLGIFSWTFILGASGIAISEYALKWAAFGKVYANIDLGEHIISEGEYSRRMAGYDFVFNALPWAVLILILIWIAVLFVIVKSDRGKQHYE